MSDLVTKYPLDLTGVNPTNKIEGEIRELSPGINRSLVPRYGAFYYDQFQIRDLDSNQILVPNDQFVPIMFHQPATERSGKEVFGGVVIVDTTVSNNVVIDYQTVGGEYQDIVPLILDIIDNLNLDSRTVAWGDLLGRPDAFAPAPHLHDAGDIYGFEYLVEAINGVREAVLLGDQGVFDELRAQIEARHATAMQTIADLTSDFNDHESNFSNPHSVNKVQVGLGNVENYPISTQSESEQGTTNSRYMTPLRTKQAITIQVGNTLDAHRADRDNPHAVTKAQVGLGSVSNYPVASLAEAEAGTATNRYMTPQRTAQAISNQAGNALGSHTADTSNPHSVTKAQVGLGSVEDLPLATQTESQTGTSHVKYMTPLRTKQAIMAIAGDALGNHVADTNNPHAVTKAQVGLGSVQNYGVASQSEAEAGASNSKYMTPLRTSQAIMQLAGNALSGHTSNTNNPHAVTKAQVGLGNVTNDRQVKRSGDTMTGDLGFAQTGRGLVWSMNTDGAAILFFNTGDSDTNSRLEFQTRDNENKFFRWTAASGAGVVISEWMTLKKAGLTVNGRVTATAFYGNGANLTGMSKSQVGLNNVSNYPVSSQGDAQAGTRNDRYMTPLRTAQAISSQAGSALSGHTSNKNNPHNVTKAQVGLGNVRNVSSPSQAEANAAYAPKTHSHNSLVDGPHNSGPFANGNSTPRSFYSVGLTMSFVESANNWPIPYGKLLNIPGYQSSQDGGALQILSPYTSSYTGNGNPMFRTGGYDNTGWSAWKTFLDKVWADGLYLGKTAKAADADKLDGIDSSGFARTTGNYESLRARATTKDDVGLGSVSNLPLASEAEAKAGTSNGRYMTPLRTKQAIIQQAGAAVSSHTSNTSNPHGVTKAQVGLGNVPNWSQATFDGRYVRTSGGVITKNTPSDVNYSNSHLELRTTNGSKVSLSFHRTGNTACQLRHENDGLILSATNQTAPASFTATGDVSAFSDRRVKDNIEVIPDALDKVQRLSGYTFTRIDSVDDRRHTGVIAQEVLEVLPEAISGGPTEKNPDGTYSVAYGNMVGLLIEAIKDQQRQIDELTRRLDR